MFNRSAVSRLLIAAAMVAPTVCVSESAQPPSHGTHWFHIVAVLVPTTAPDGSVYDDLQAGRTVDGFDTVDECDTAMKARPGGFVLSDGSRVVLSYCIEARRPPSRPAKMPNYRNKSEPS